MKKRRLLKLAEFLETAGLPGEFTMIRWSGPKDVGQRLGCGSIGCALGWATTITSFYRAGLRLNGLGIPEYGNRSGSEAAATFFDISDVEARDIFEPDDMSALTSRRGRRIVAKRIRKLVADHD